VPLLGAPEDGLRTGRHRPSPLLQRTIIRRAMGQPRRPFFRIRSGRPNSGRVRDNAVVRCIAALSSYWAEGKPPDQTVPIPTFPDGLATKCAFDSRKRTAERANRIPSLLESSP
jgi:hypothetical protein